MLKSDPRSPHKLKPMPVQTAIQTPSTRFVDKVARPAKKMLDKLGDFILNTMSGSRR